MLNILAWVSVKSARCEKHQTQNTKMKLWFSQKQSTIIANRITYKSKGQENDTETLGLGFKVWQEWTVQHIRWHAAWPPCNSSTDWKATNLQCESMAPFTFTFYKSDQPIQWRRLLTARTSRRASPGAAPHSTVRCSNWLSVRLSISVTFITASFSYKHMHNHFAYLWQ